MALKLLHTADWHLGQQLHDRSREPEHRAFLGWLLGLLQDEQVDALVLAGDIFDSANPPLSAQRLLWDFLVRARSRHPRLDLVLVGGNHDSAQRLDTTAPLLTALGVTMVGALPWATDPQGERRLDLERLLVPLTDAEGAVVAWMAAVPFLRPGDLPRHQAGDDPQPHRAVAAVYEELTRAMLERRLAHQALLATAHAYVAGGALSELSERRLAAGHQQALPAEIFPPDLAYVALGHLHMPQVVGTADRLRYAGSPLPLALDERSYTHQVCLVQLDGPALSSVRSHRTPRVVDILRVPGAGAAPLDQVLAAIAQLPEHSAATAPWRRAFLEVHVLLDQPQPGLRRQVQAALDDRGPVLARLMLHYTGTGLGLQRQQAGARLSDLTPERVFKACWERRYEAAPPPEVLDTFRLLEAEALANGTGGEA